MKRIESTFKSLRRQSKGALIPFIMAGDPNPDDTFSLASEIIRAGADILELGIPFSDPVGDGPVIQRAGKRALEAGTGIDAVMKIVSKIRMFFNVPIILMTYYNPIYRFGPDSFISLASDAGADGIIIVDLPVEEGDLIFSKISASGLAPILMVAPTTKPEREKKIINAASGFIYYVSRPGTTGARPDIQQNLREKVKKLKSRTDLPVAVGFGLSNKAQVSEVLSFADGAVVGSALVALIEKGINLSEKAVIAGRFINKLKY